MLAGHASGCWRSALGAGVPYNREKNEKCNFLLVVPANKVSFAGTVLANKVLFSGTVPPNKVLFARKFWQITTSYT